MLYVKDIMCFLNQNKGKTLSYGNGYSVQVYFEDALQANIMQDGQTIMKIEERRTKQLKFFLLKEDKDNVIEYNVGCEIQDSETILDLFKVFKEHKDLEKVLVALLQLQ